MRIVTATLGLWMGVVQVLSVSADTDNGRSISSEDLLMQILHAHDAAIEQLSVLRFEYAREVFEERRSQDGEFTIVSNIKGRETRSRDQLQCLVSYSSEFPDGGGDIYSDSWEKALILNEHLFAYWVIGMVDAHAWELSTPRHRLQKDVETQVSMTKCPITVKAYGDGNMTLRELKNFVQIRPNWRIDVKHVSDTEPSEVELLA